MESWRRTRDGEWLDFVADLMAAPLTRWPDEQATRLLVTTFGALGGGYQARSASGSFEQRQWPPELFGDRLDDLYRWSQHGAPTQHPVMRYYLATGDTCCMQVADVPTRFADAAVLARWHELCRFWGQGHDVRSQVALPVRMGRSGHRAFVLGRPDPFTVQEMDLIARLRRLLTGLDRQITTFSRWSQRSGPEAAEVAGAVALTPRELAVLELLADGLTAASIGRRLTIAERTVQKHLQHCYTKLGVADRLGAVLRAQTIGLLARRDLPVRATQFPA